MKNCIHQNLSISETSVYKAYKLDSFNSAKIHSNPKTIIIDSVICDDCGYEFTPEEIEKLKIEWE